MEERIYYGPLSKYDKRDGPFKVFRVEVKETNSRIYEVTGVSSMKAAIEYVDENGVYDSNVQEVDGYFEHHRRHKPTPDDGFTVVPCLYHRRSWRILRPGSPHPTLKYCTTLYALQSNPKGPMVCRSCQRYIEDDNCTLIIEEVSA